MHGLVTSSKTQVQVLERRTFTVRLLPAMGYKVREEDRGKAFHNYEVFILGPRHMIKILACTQSPQALDSYMPLFEHFVGHVNPH